MVAAASTKQVLDLVMYVKRQFGDESGVQITDADIIGWVNMGQTQMVSDNHFLQKIVTTTVYSIGQAEYPLPSDIINIDGIRYGNNQLQAMDIEVAMGMLGDEANAKGSPAYWWIYGNSFFLYPTPASNSAAITVFYRCYPAEVTSLADPLSVPDRYYDALCSFVMSKAHELDENTQVAMASRQNYTDTLYKLSHEETKISGSFPVVEEYSY